MFVRDGRRCLGAWRNDSAVRERERERERERKRESEIHQKKEGKREIRTQNKHKQNKYLAVVEAAKGNALWFRIA